MKTTKFFSVLFLALIFTGANAVSSNLLTDNSRNLDNSTTWYAVNIHFSSKILICNSSLYLIKIKDETGRLVAPAQVFEPGISKYAFKETGTPKGKYRIVTLEIPKNVDPIGCPYILMTKPDVRTGPFFPGQTYSFDLYPQILNGPFMEE